MAPNGAPMRTGLGDAGVVLDPQAKAEYRRRLTDLRDELEEAGRLNDAGRTERLRAEIEFLTDELARSVGLGGRDRHAASATERARVAVTKAIRYALAKIAEHDPALAEHLGAAVRTGSYCASAPTDRERVLWITDLA